VSSGNALCDRGRLFGNVTQYYNYNYAGDPFPVIASDGEQTDYFTFNTSGLPWTLKSWFQFDDQFNSAAQCDYGGGAGVFKPSYSGSYSTQTVPSP
jgi:hypothetical protein